MLKSAVLGLAVIGSLILSMRFSRGRGPSEKPTPSEYVSPFLNSLQETLMNSTSSPTLRKLIQNCMLNTLKTTVVFNTTDAFVITGDIDAMWLRDSMNQLHPFVEFVRNDSKIDWLVRRVIARQASQIRADPYANAFQYEIAESKDHALDTSRRFLFEAVPFSAIFDISIVFERKFEIDSLAAFLRLSNEYFSSSRSTDFVDLRWLEAYELIVKVINRQRKSFADEDADSGASYTFSREASEPYDTLSHGRGNPAGSCGLIRSSFRPSDDATVFQYFIPGNCMMQAELERSIPLLGNVSLSGYDTRVRALLAAVSTLSTELKSAIYKYGVTTDARGRDIFAYEVDCFGNYLKMDDANSPSLLALPYLGFVKADDQIYKNTRDFVWSEQNPWFFKGSRAEGIGGPHVGYGYIWPMSLIMRGLTSTNKTEIEYCLRTVSETTGGLYFMHESFNKDNDRDYTRSWFAWANTLYGHFVLKIYREYPDILANYK